MRIKLTAKVDNGEVYEWWGVEVDDFGRMLGISIFDKKKEKVIKRFEQIKKDRELAESLREFIEV